MKCYFKKNLNLGILIFGLSLFLYNCQKKEEIVHQEFQQNGAFSKISFDEFKSKTNLNNEFESFSRFFDINKPTSKASFNKKSSGNFDDAIILTDNIIRIKKDDFSTYTFTILTQTENYEFYNLVLYVDNNQEIYKSHILKYTPSGKWLADTTKHFSGNVKIINNDIFNVDNLLQSKSSLSSKSILLEECIDDVIISYECSNRVKGHREGNPGPEGGCLADEFYVYINILPIPCDGGEDNGDFDPETGGGEGGTTSGGGDDDIVTAPNTEPDAWKIKNFESGTLNTEERNYYNSDPDIKGTIDNYLKLKNFSYTPKQEAKASLKFGESLKLNFEQFKWVFENRNSKDLIDLKEDLIDSSLETITAFKMKIDASRAKNGWNFLKIGTFRNRPSLKYKATFNPNLGETMYLLENGLVLYQSSTERVINKKVTPNTIASSEVTTDGYNYIYNYNTKTWYEYRMPPTTPNTKADIDFLLDAFWTGVKIAGRYATPLEDVIILIDGKDFDGVEQGKVQTAGFMIVGFIPGGKLLKPISKGTGKLWKVIIKNGDKVITRTVKELTEETLQHFDEFAPGTRNLIDEALRKGDILDDEIIIEVGQEIADISAKKGRKLTWEEVKVLFKRGNDFNDKASDIYEFNEIVLETGKRLDSYIPGLEIISRKATTLSNIKPETFKSYLKELITKYPKGSILNSSKLPKGNKLVGDYFLEIPLSNKSFFESSSTLQTVLTQFNVDNNILIKIKYLAE